MNIIIIGRTEILYKTTVVLVEEGHSIKMIVTAKEAPEYKATAKDFETLASKVGAKFLYSPHIGNAENIDFIKSAGGADIAVSVNYPGVIPQPVIDLFPLGILNAHGGDLPRYRGNACQAWAIINGEERIGLCVHKMEGGRLDSGDIIAREYLNIDINTKIGDVHRWMDEKIPSLFLQALGKLEKDSGYILEKQSDDPADALRCHPRAPEDAKIDWSKTNEEILRLINASSSPYAGAFCEVEGKKFIIWDAELFDDDEKYVGIPGQAARVDIKDGFVIVLTGRGKLKINEVECGSFRGRPGEVITSTRKRLA